MIYVDLSPLTDHLWQSTLCGAAAWLLTLALRRNHAAVRYRIWLAASVKFLVPLSLLVSIGAQLGWRGAPAIRQPQWSFVIDDIGRPFAAPASALHAVAPPVSDPVPAILLTVWLCGFAASIILWLRCWRQIRAARHGATPIALGLAIPVVSSPAHMEPGVFGVRKPVLLLPEGITDRLTPDQLHAILAHEMCHVRRRDNLTAAIHTVVESVFWFHPLTWWIRARLEEERERACDEEVLQSGSEPLVYAEGILNVCKFYVESPLACVSGVTGSDLRKRIEAIVTNRSTKSLAFGQRLLLAVAGTAILAGPIAIGVYAVPGQAQVQSSKPVFEVASVKQTPAGTRDFWFRPPSHGINAANIPLERFILFAYNLKSIQLTGGPNWIRQQNYDIVAKSPPNTGNDRIPEMLQALLADRFNLMVHRETKVLPIYGLVLGKGGLKLHEVREMRPGDGDFKIGRGRLSGQGVTMQDLAGMLIGQVDRIVVDRTGLNGKFDIALEWTPDVITTGGNDREALPDANGPSLVTALFEQLGLKLEASKGPVQIVVIDHVERPTAN